MPEDVPLQNCVANMAGSATVIRDSVISVTRWCNVTEMTHSRRLARGNRMSVSCMEG